MSEFIGSRVSIPGTRGYGVLKYYGPIEGKQGLFAGIELIGPIAASRGKNSGSVNGLQYFDVLQPMSGLFLPIERLKQSNPQLSNIDHQSDFQSSLLTTPSPSSRSKSRNVSQKSPVHLNSQILNIPKREAKKLSESNSRKTSLYSTLNQSKKSLDELTDRIKLQKEFNELKQKYEANEKEMQQKTEILNELRNSVNDLQPLLEEYELELSEKDNKLNKQRTEFERAREEWRQSLDLLVSSHLETEIIYQQKLHDLHQHIEKIMKEKEPSSSGKTVDTYNLKIQDLELEKSILEKNAQTKMKSQQIQIDQLTQSLETCQKELGELTKASSYQQLTGSTENDEKIEELEKQNKKLGQDVDSLQFIIEDLQSKIKTKDTRIDELEAKVEEEMNEKFKSVHISDQSQQLDVVIDDLKRQLENRPTLEEVADLKHQLKNRPTLDEFMDSKRQLANKPVSEELADLRHQLEIRPTFDELSELQNALDEIDTLHQSELNNNAKKILELTEKNKELQVQLQEINSKNASLAEVKQDPDSSIHKSQPLELNPSGHLPIYAPVTPTDPSSGKDDWCGLCERDGHSSINCPYENDMF